MPVTKSYHQLFPKYWDNGTIGVQEIPRKTYLKSKLLFIISFFFMGKVRILKITETYFDA